MAHKFDRAEFASRNQAKADLEKTHTPPHTVPGLVERVDLIETMIGVVGK
ncbi:hypothetical protein KAW18_16960 [candidate division WOR-3 bacterium]|nr:hypothetical protein [candidate division WOR-3 bacterium]